MSSSNSDIIAYLNAVSILIDQIGGPFLIILGTFGNFFNIIIFTRPTLRNSPCTLYFLAGTCTNLVTLYTYSLPRLLASGWRIDVAKSNDVLCKIRHFSAYPAQTLVLWFVVLATVDRFLSTSRSVKLRQFSRLSLARKVTVFIILITYLSHIHILFYYYTTPERGCRFNSDAYNVFLISQSVVFSMIVPLICMTIFGILMLRNVRKVRHRVIPQVDNEQNQRFCLKDRQLLRMLLLQLTVCTSISIPFAIINLYNIWYTIILQLARSTYDQAAFLVVYNIFRLLFNTNPVIGFFTYTMTSPKFRAEFIRCSHYGLKVILTATGLFQCLPARVQERLQRENHLPTIQASGRLSRRTNMLQSNQQQQQQEQPPIATAAV